MSKHKSNLEIPEEELEKKYGKPSPRELKLKKRKHAPKGGTLGGQTKRVKEAKFYIRKKKPEIKIIDKTKK